MSHQETLQSAWTGGRQGKMSALNQAKAWALREAWRDGHAGHVGKKPSPLCNRPLAVRREELFGFATHRTCMGAKPWNPTASALAADTSRADASLDCVRTCSFFAFAGLRRSSEICKPKASMGLTFWPRLASHWLQSFVARRLQQGSFFVPEICFWKSMHRTTKTT